MFRFSYLTCGYGLYYNLMYCVTHTMYETLLSWYDIAVDGVNGESENSQLEMWYGWRDKMIVGIADVSIRIAIAERRTVVTAAWKKQSSLNECKWKIERKSNHPFHYFFTLTAWPTQVVLKQPCKLLGKVGKSFKSILK